MEIHVDSALGQVTLRHRAAATILIAIVALVVGVGVPALVERYAPGAIVAALLVPAAAAFVVIRRLTDVAVLDESGVTLSASRRFRRRVPWSDTTALGIADARLAVTTTTGRQLTGPRCDKALLASLQAGAAELGLLPPGLTPKYPPQYPPTT